MSLDAVGRVVVGSGHFIQQATQAGQHVLVGGGHAPIEQLQRLGDIFRRHSRGLAADAQMRALTERFEGANPSPYDPDRFRGAPGPNNNAFSQESQQRNWQLLYEASIDMLEGAGWAMAGDLQAALQKEIDASLKVGEVWWNNTKELFNLPPFTPQQ